MDDFHQFLMRFLRGGGRQLPDPDGRLLYLQMYRRRVLELGEPATGTRASCRA